MLRPERNNRAKKFMTQSITCTFAISYSVKLKPTGLEWPRGFQEVKVPRLHDNGTG